MYYHISKQNKAGMPFYLNLPRLAKFELCKNKYNNCKTRNP